MYRGIWFKFFGSDWLSDPKILRLSAVDRNCYLTLLCMASAASESGTIRNIDEDTLLTLTRLNTVEASMAVGVLSRLEADDLVTLKERVTKVTEKPALRIFSVPKVTRFDVHLPTFDARQTSYMTNAERQASFRERSKAEHSEPSYPVTKVTLDKSRADKKRGDTDASSGEESPYDDEKFLAFWQAFPKRVGKGDAWKAWKALRPSRALADTIIQAVMLHKGSKQWLKDNGDYIPHPATFLRQRRWEDEPEAPRAPDTGTDTSRFAGRSLKVSTGS